MTTSRNLLTLSLITVAAHSQCQQPVEVFQGELDGNTFVFTWDFRKTWKMLFHIIITSFDLRICVCAYSVPSCWNETHLTPTSKNLFEIYIYAGDLNCLQQMLKLPLKLILCRLECINPQFDQVWWYVSYSEFDQMRLQDTLDPQNEPFKYQPNSLLRSTLNYL